jgi:hypothetical protein
MRRHAIRRAIKVADEVWVATALLHREHPARADFTVQEITRRAEQAGIEGHLRPSLYVHAIRHCVANLPPSPGRYRMLTATGPDTRRLFRSADAFHPQRDGAKTMPAREHLPERYQGLLDWYVTEFQSSKTSAPAQAESDPILDLRGVGRDLWGREHPDDYVRRLREGWW